MSIDPKSDHYDVGGVEVVNVIRAKLTDAQFEGYLLGNVIKYVLRANHKGDFCRDIEKASVYLEQLKQGFSLDNVSPLPKRQSEVVKLTAPRIDKMARGVKTYYVRDSEQPGLQVRITPNGAKSFIWYRKVNGKPRRITLGRHPALTLADARNSARKLEAERAANATLEASQ